MSDAAPTNASAADDRLKQAIGLIQRLVAAIERERTLFQTRRARELDAILAEKETLTDAYAREMRLLKQDRRWLDAASPAARQQLRDAVVGLRTLLGDYSQAIIARRSVVEGLVRSLGQEVARQRQPMTAYGAAGAPCGARPTAIAFDQNA